MSCVYKRGNRERKEGEGEIKDPEDRKEKQKKVSPFFPLYCLSITIVIHLHNCISQNWQNLHNCISQNGSKNEMLRSRGKN